MDERTETKKEYEKSKRKDRKTNIIMLRQKRNIRN